MRVLLVLSALVASAAMANEITVEPRRAHVGESIEILVWLEGSFAGTEGLRIPHTTNLAIERSSSSSEFRIVNGVSSYVKSFRYEARALRSGPAVVGPIDVISPRGVRMRLEAVQIQILPDEAPRSNDPAIALGQSESTGGLFVTVEADKPSAYLGEQVNVTWTLYSRERTHGFRLTSVPVLESFWVEEIPQTRQQSETVLVDGEVLHKTTIRRVALFPLRTGELRISPLETVAQILVPDDFFRGWGMFERRVQDFRVRSSTLPLEVKSVPADTTATGELSMECSAPVVPPKGPVTFDATISGTGNLRAVNAPELEKSLSAAVEVQPRQTIIDREVEPMRMSRSWRFVIFPRGAGRLEIPTVQFDYFDPATAQKQSLRCTPGNVLVGGANLAPSRGQTSLPPSPQTSRRRDINVPFAIGLLALVVSGAVWAGIRKRNESPLLAELWPYRTDARRLRALLHERVAAEGLHLTDLFQDESPRGESFRALHSLIDLMEKEPWVVEESAKDLRRRARDFDRELRRQSSQQSAVSSQ